MTETYEFAHDPENTAVLVRAARAGGIERFHELFEHIAPSLYAWASMRILAPLRPQLDAQDLVEEVWVRAMRGFTSFDRSGLDYRSWVFRLAKSALVEAVRKSCDKSSHRIDIGPSQRAFTQLDCPARVRASAARLARDDGMRRFLDFAERLSGEERQVLAYCGLEGMELADVAVRTDASVVFVKEIWTSLAERLRASGGADGIVIER